MKKIPIKLKETPRVKEYNDVLKRVAYLKKTGQIEALKEMIKPIVKMKLSKRAAKTNILIRAMNGMADDIIAMVEKEIKKLTKEVGGLL